MGRMIHSSEDRSEDEIRFLTRLASERLLTVALFLNGTENGECMSFTIFGIEIPTLKSRQDLGS